jgi:hypothetical protein
VNDDIYRVVEERGQYFLVADIAGPFKSNAEAWSWLMRTATATSLSPSGTTGSVQSLRAKMTSIRTERIDAAVSAAGQLISALSEKGPINSDQADLLVTASVRAIVPNAKDWEIRDGAVRILKELEDEDKSRNGR